MFHLGVCARTCVRACVRGAVGRRWRYVLNKGSIDVEVNTNLTSKVKTDFFLPKLGRGASRCALLRPTEGIQEKRASFKGPRSAIKQQCF